jgi:arylsulfatase A-like enzyme
MHPSRILQGAGIAAVALYPLYAAALSSGQALRMHSPTPLANFAMALIVNMAILTVLFTLVGSRIASSRIGHLFRPALPGVLLASLVEAFYLHQHGVPSITLWLATFFAGAICTLLLQRFSKRGIRIVMRTSSIALASLGLFGLLVVLQLFRFCFWRPAPNSLSTPEVSERSQKDHPRIVWILFDELSYDQLFEHRVRGFELPNFDALRQTSTLFTNGEAAANVTVLAIPSMFLGRTITGVRYENDNRLFVASSGRPVLPFDSAETPFALAQKNGMTTSVVGWYNPYCGMLARYLSRCYWTNDVLEPSVFLVGDGFWRNLTDTWVRYGVALHFLHDKRRPAKRIQVLQDLTERSEKQLTQAEPDLIFIHLPVPHPPSIYDLKRNQFDTSGERSYVDSLALADRTLGKLMAAMQSSPAWPRTNIIVCGDHSWRTWMWRGLPNNWSATDEAASNGGVFDPRPMLMVHLAGQTEPAIVSQRFPLIRVHDIVDSLLTGRQPSFR